MNNLPQRKQLRLKQYDYSQPGYYFVTICTKDKLDLFGQVVGADDSVRPLDSIHPSMMQANGIGKIVCGCWNRINEIYDNVEADVFCLMPNHIHGVIVISEGVGQGRLAVGQGRPTLQKIMQGFKSVTTRMCFKYGHNIIWQRGYYEHIIRNELELEKIREYIMSNPSKWQDDKYYN